MTIQNLEQIITETNTKFHTKQTLASLTRQIPAKTKDWQKMKSSGFVNPRVGYSIYMYTGYLSLPDSDPLEGKKILQKREKDRTRFAPASVSVGCLFALVNFGTKN